MNLNEPKNEKEFTSQVKFEARLQGWLTYHTFDSRRSDPGFPDLCLVRDQRLIFAELKFKKGRVSEYQQEWLDRLDKICPPVEVYLWRYPDDVEKILKILE